MTLKQSLKRVPGLRNLVRRLRGTPTLTESRELLLSKMPRESVCAEIGVFEGAFSERILLNVQPRYLHLIDPWTFEKGNEQYEKALVGYNVEGCDGQEFFDQRLDMVKRRLGRQIESGQVVVHRASASSIVDRFGDGYFDWIYIDGNHLYEYVMQDLELYYPKVKPGGYITGDDYGTEGWWFNGVQKAVDEFVGRLSNVSLELDESQFIIKKPAS